MSRQTGGMSLPPYPPAPRKSSLSTVVIVIAGVAGLSLLLCAGLCLFSLFSGKDTPTDAPAAVAPRTVATSPVDKAELARYWQDNFSGTTWYALAKQPEWDGLTLTVKTSLFPDNDAIAPAESMCVALSGYWLSVGKFEGVRVLDSAGNILVSRHTLGDQCTWRR